MTLRERLDNLESLGLTAEQHIQAVAELRNEVGHDIVALNSDIPLRRYTCLVHALGFAGKPDYEDIAAWEDEVFAGKEFATWLREHDHLQELSDSAPPPAGSLVMYFDGDDTFTHVGLVADDGKVQSKWGTHGLYSHSRMEVPQAYGDTVRNFGAIPYEIGIELFYEYAKSKGIELE